MDWESLWYVNFVHCSKRRLHLDWMLSAFWFFNFHPLVSTIFVCFNNFHSVSEIPFFSDSNMSMVIERNEKRKMENPFSVFFFLTYPCFEFSRVIIFSIFFSWLIVLVLNFPGSSSSVFGYEHQPREWFYFKLFWHVFGNY